MKIISTYGVKIKTYNHIFNETIEVSAFKHDQILQKGETQE